MVSSRDEVPAIVQLQKWESSLAQLKLTEFCEAFISPAKRQLLLLSYEHEALLLPLKDDSSKYNGSKNGSTESVRRPASLALAGGTYSSDVSFGRSYSKCSFVCDVNSLTWGSCGDTYNQKKDGGLRELLFVSGKHGVIVHAFYQPEKSTDSTETALEGELGQGLWVEWGPSAHCINRPSGSIGTPHEFSQGDKNGDLSSGSTSKRWLQTFLAKVEPIERDGKIWTRFPDKSLLPRSAEVVSFSIFDSNSLMHNFLPHANNKSEAEATLKEVFLDPVDATRESDKSLSGMEIKPEVLSKFLGVRMGCLYECPRVFSSNSHHLVGFALTLVNPITLVRGDASKKGRGETLVVVTRLASCGIQWNCSVRLDKSLYTDQMDEWSDLQFSENLLVCLRTSGLIFFYGATHGEYISHLDIVQICGINSSASFPMQDQFYTGSDLARRSADVQGRKVETSLTKSTSHIQDMPRNRVFKKLTVAPCTSLLAAVDGYGIVYVIHACYYLPEKYYLSEKLLPKQHLVHGILGYWEAGGSEIGHQRLLSTLSRACYSENPSASSRGFVTDKKGSDNFHKINDIEERLLSGFTSSSKTMNQTPSSPKLASDVARIILPIHGYRTDDIFCLSSIGVTQLIRKPYVKSNKNSQVVHSCLNVGPMTNDDSCLNSECEMLNLLSKKETSTREAVGCAFQGCLYLVTQSGLSVVLPSISVPSFFLPVESFGYRESSNCIGIEHCAAAFMGTVYLKQPWPPWKVEILDRVLVYEGPEEADRLCLDNGWDLGISRTRRLQLALHYLKFDDIEQSLEMLVGVDKAEDGILRMLFAVIYLVFQNHGNDNDASAASRLLVLASAFATKMIRTYGFEQHKKHAFMLQNFNGSQLCCLPSVLSYKQNFTKKIFPKLHEMSQFLEVIRNLQRQLIVKYRRPGQGLAQLDGKRAVSPVDGDLFTRGAHISEDPIPLDAASQNEDPFPITSLTSNGAENLILMPIEPLDKTYFDSENSVEVSIVVSHGGIPGRRVSPPENPKDMMARWETNNLDYRNVVNDALLSGRLPLAVLQLHLQHLKDLATCEKPLDIFSKVHDIGRAIAYSLFLKGETALAVATLQRLGEDLETSLRQLMLGSVRRSLRMQIAEEMKRHGYLRRSEWKLLERMSLVERFYPCSNFWRAVHRKQKDHVWTSSSSSSIGGMILHVSHSQFLKKLAIQCGEVDGAILGVWADDQISAVHELDEDDSDFDAGYWAAAAVWSYAWDERTINRILLDQPSINGVNVLWESQLEFYICHNRWEEVCRLLDIVPLSFLSDGSLKVELDHVPPSCSRDLSDNASYICPAEKLVSVCMDIPDIKLLKLSATSMCSMWLRELIEQELAKKFMFLKEYWEGTAEIVMLLARSGFLSASNKVVQAGPVKVLNKLIVHYCVQYGLPHLLDLYIHHNQVVLDDDSFCFLLEAAGDCEWAKWFLLSRVKGREYDASFSNAHFIATRNMVCGGLYTPEVEGFIHTVNDMAKGVGEMAALATLMYAPVPIEDCLTSSSVNKHSTSSAMCTLENLRPTLRHFPTLWRTLVAACFGQNTPCDHTVHRFKNVIGNSALSKYVNWRDTIFFSSGHDASLLQMLPWWFPKAVRRLVQLYVQGPLGWQSRASLSLGESFLDQDVDLLIETNEHMKVNAMSWEASIDKRIKEELYDSSFKESGIGLDHHLHRGRPLAAFNLLLDIRVHNFKSQRTYEAQSGTSEYGQSNVQSDIQTLLAPATESEMTLLSFVIPLALRHFEDSTLVSSCAFLLELCGLSASMLWIDVSSLKRISFCCKFGDYSEHGQSASNGSAVAMQCDITGSLAEAVADDYLQHDNMNIFKQKGTRNSVGCERPSDALMLALHHLEKASLPRMSDGKTCGYWLLTGDGDGVELRTQQKAASQHWNLVTLFCQMHNITSSTKYLALLARDNDWVGFLSEAQIGGYPFDTVAQVASTEFSDPRLRVHILTVLKSMQSKRKVGSPLHSDTADKRNASTNLDQNLDIPVELFGILAVCEKQTDPGKVLLMKANELNWSILALVASCFPDVSLLSCLTVWLEITAARETSLTKANNIAFQIAKNVGAAVETTNSVSAGSSTRSCHYNQRNPKRRRLTGPVSADVLADTSSTAASASGGIIYDGGIFSGQQTSKGSAEHSKIRGDSEEGHVSLSEMVGVLCEEHFFLPLLRAFEMFIPSCALLSFIRALQAFSQMRLSEASTHLGCFSVRIKEEPFHLQTNIGREGQIGLSWISSTAVRAADAMLSTCPSPYEKRCLLQLLAGTDFGDGGLAATHYRQLYVKTNLAEPCLHKGNNLHLGNENLDDASLLEALLKNRNWEESRNWARQLEASGGPWKSVCHHVTETQAESMVAEWKEFLWDVPEERIALWRHCQTLFLRYSFPALQAGLFFLKHAEAVEKTLPASELYELLLLSLQWLSGMNSQSPPVYPLHILREIETRAWLLAVESEARVKSEGNSTITDSKQDSESKSSIIDQTASFILKMDNHINTMRGSSERNDMAWEVNQPHSTSGSTKTKRRVRSTVPSKMNPSLIDAVEKTTEDDSAKLELSFSRWEERVKPEELERAVLSLLEFGQVTAAKQLQNKLSPACLPSEFILVDAALKLASISTPRLPVAFELLDEEIRSVILSYNIQMDQHLVDPMQVLEALANIFVDGSGRGLCKKVLAAVKAANVLGLSFPEAFNKRPIELLQLLSLKAQDSFEEAKLLVQTHSMPAASIAQILAESFLKGLLAAHRGGYMESQKEEGPAPLLWRFSDFLKWAELCPSRPEVGHALMRLVITGQEIPHACEVELLILSHHFYKLSACLDGVDVLVAFATNRVEAYVSEEDFSCLARLITGVGNFRALSFILGILVENGQLDLLLQKHSAAVEANTGSTAEAVRGFRMAVLTALKQFTPNDVDAFAMVYSHFDMRHETASLLESQARNSSSQWFLRQGNDQNEDLLEAMRHFIEAAGVYSSIDAGNKARAACAQASLVSLQIRIPDFRWLNLSETNARRALVEQSRFQEALIVAEAYGLNQPSEWALVLWNQMLNPEVTEQFVAEFVAALPLRPPMLVELAKFYRAEVTARGDQSQLSVWLTGGGLPAEWAKYLGRSFRCLLKRTRDLRLRVQMASMATGFDDVADACLKELDRATENAGPLVLKKGHGGAYIPLM